jgi:hypothetical protein
LAAHNVDDTAKQLPEFEVASIKLNKSESGSSDSSFDHGRYSATNEGIKGLIQYGAYGTPGPQIEGGPAWLASERFDIEAKVDDATAVKMEKLGPEERSQMKRQLIEQLLADRFKLAVHWETKELPVYALVADKGGAKLTRRAMLWGVPVRLQAGAPESLGRYDGAAGRDIDRHPQPGSGSRCRRQDGARRPIRSSSRVVSGRWVFE